MKKPETFTVTYYDYDEVLEYFKSLNQDDTRDLWSQICHIFEVPNGGYVDVTDEIDNLSKWSNVEEGSILSKFLIFYRDNFDSGYAPLRMHW